MIAALTSVGVALIVALFGVYLVERVRPLVVMWLENRGKAVKPVTLPADLLMLANAERVGWAREDSTKRFYELYEEHGHDWDRVRASLTGLEHGSTTGH